jgi:hypothetical protein
MALLCALLQIVLIVHMLGNFAYLAFALPELPNNFVNVSVTNFVLVAFSCASVFADLSCVLELQAGDRLIGRPHIGASTAALYTFGVISTIAHCFMLVVLAISYSTANTSITTSENPANDLEYCCVFTGHVGCPGVPCDAGHKTVQYQLRANWRFLLLFWVIVIQTAADFAMLILAPNGVTKRTKQNLGLIQQPPASTSTSSSSETKKTM